MKMKMQPIYKSQAGRESILAFYDRILERWPLPYQSLIVPTRLGSTHVIACGDHANPPLVLLHGSSSNAAMWIGDVLEYARCFRVFAVDIPGEPGKSAETRPDLSSSAYSEWLEEVCRGVGIERTMLAGISLGGFIALKFSCVFPDRIERLVLICPSGIAPQMMTFLLLAMVLLPLGEWGRDRLFRVLTGKQKIAQEAIQYLGLIASQFRPRFERVPLFLDDELKRLQMPVLLLAGERDALLDSRGTARRLERLLPRLEAHVFEDKGHVLIGLADRIMAFLVRGREREGQSV
jgi:pimeloyl-ACP methyl ester carboxylesterase